MLATGGRIIVSLPNIASWQAKFAGPMWLHLDVPRHRFHFSLQSMRSLAERVGMKVSKVATFSPEYGPYALLQGVLSRMGLGNFLFRSMIRPGGTRDILKSPLFWVHLAFSPIIALLAVVSVVVEVLASAFGRGATLTVELKKN